MYLFQKSHRREGFILLQSVLKRYPTLTESDIRLQDDGEGVFVSYWNNAEPKPTPELLIVWAEEDANLTESPTEIEETKKQITDLAFELMIKGVV